jgi:hypothetical protein
VEKGLPMVLGDFPLEPFAFIRSLMPRVKKKAEELQTLEEYARREQTAWTDALKLILKEDGDALGCESYCRFSRWFAATRRLASTPISSKGYDSSSEFLLDFVWWKRYGTSEGALLACESEFGNPFDRSKDVEAIDTDFWKLLVFKAPVKMMVFDVISGGDREREILSKLTASMRSYIAHVEGELYLFVDTSPASKVWSARIPRSGLIDNLELSLLT